VKAKRTVDPTGLEDYDLEYLTSHLDKATTHEERGRLVAELEIRAAIYESTLGIVIRRGFPTVIEEFQRRQERRQRSQKAEDPQAPEEEEVWVTPPPPKPVPSEFEVWNGMAPYKEYCRMILESGWDYVDRRPKKDPIQHSATVLHQFTYDRVTKDPDEINGRKMVIDDLLEKQKTLLQMIIEAHSHWARTLKVVSNE
jgi:hypothetical protein